MFPLYRSHNTWMSGQSNILLWKKPKLWILSNWFPSASTVTRKYLESRTKWKQKFDEQLSAHVASIRMTSPKRLWILPTLNRVICCAREWRQRAVFVMALESKPLRALVFGKNEILSFPFWYRRMNCCNQSRYNYPKMAQMIRLNLDFDGFRWR